MLCSIVIFNMMFYCGLLNAMETSEDLFIGELGNELCSIEQDKQTNNVSITPSDNQNKKSLLKEYYEYSSSGILNNGKYKDGVDNNFDAIYLEFCEKVAEILKKQGLQGDILNNRHQPEFKKHFFSLIMLAVYKETVRAKIVELRKHKVEKVYEVRREDGIVLSCYEKYSDQEAKGVVTVADLVKNSSVNCKIQLYYTNLNDSTSEKFYLWIPGMIPHHVNDTQKFIRGIVPGEVLLYNGPVNNKYIHYTKDRYYKSYISSLLSAFNYHREACTLLNVLKYCYMQGHPVGNLSGVCYGWQTLVCALHALVSNDEKACNVRNELDIDFECAELLLKSIYYVEIQNPMIQLLPSVQKVIEWPLRYTGLIKPESNGSRVSAFFSSGSNILGKSIFYHLLPSISHVKDYNGDTLTLLNEIRATGYDDLRHIHLCMTWQKHDDLVAPVSLDLLNTLGDMFKFYPCGSSKGNHNEKSRTFNQHSYVNFVRKQLKVPFFDYVKYDFSANEELLGAVSSLEQYRLEKNWQSSKALSEDFF